MSDTLPAEQPMPVPNDRTSVPAMVRADLDIREQVGISRYGTALQPFNGRDALRDAYEEAMDLTLYLRQVIAERDARAATEAGCTDGEAVHRCPVGDAALTPCCGRTPFELPGHDRLTVDDHLVTCTGAPAAG